MTEHRQGWSTLCSHVLELQRGTCHARDTIKHREDREEKMRSCVPELQSITALSVRRTRTACIAVACDALDDFHGFVECKGSMIGARFAQMKHAELCRVVPELQHLLYHGFAAGKPGQESRLAGQGSMVD
eukprot:1157334-Pelagomonas_calceolata.AAC.19